jgi:hypothetical protein
MATIENAIQKRHKIPKRIKGMVIGLFTIEEYSFYIKIHQISIKE